ncbi:GtrA family protein [Pectinatus frisingensis]|uniref:GtrA family protein n=1 Tax=Pectinatus frisingensis TaxID=865 RepID=UPI0018C4E2AA|nr:GtrA family protein [Pectinatus frisingensis]
MAVSTAGLAKKSSVIHELIYYILAGGISFLLDFSLLYILTAFFNFYYWISAVFAFIAGLILNYMLSVHFIFTDHILNNRPAEFSIFTLIGIVGLGFNELFIWFFTAVCNNYYLISKIYTAIIVFFWNFGSRKLLLFRKKNGDN